MNGKYHFGNHQEARRWGIILDFKRNFGVTMHTGWHQTSSSEEQTRLNTFKVTLLSSKRPSGCIFSSSSESFHMKSNIFEWIDIFPFWLLLGGIWKPKKYNLGGKALRKTEFSSSECRALLGGNFVKHFQMNILFQIWHLHRKLIQKSSSQSYITFFPSFSDFCCLVWVFCYM